MTFYFAKSERKVRNEKLGGGVMGKQRQSSISVHKEMCCNGQ